jgi:hypothetical protein
MPVFGFTEKEWDKVRPSSVKKTGVSEAMRAVLKDVPKDLKALTNAKDCDDAVKLLDTLDTALDKADKMVKAVAKDDKQNAAAKLKVWRAQVKDGHDMVIAHKDKLLLAAATKAAYAKMDEIVAKAKADTQEAEKLAGEIGPKVKAGQTLDLEKLSKDQQERRKALRDSHKYSTKAGFVEAIKFIDEIHKTGVNPNAVPPPPTLQTLKGLLDNMEAALNKVGDVLEEAADKEANFEGDGELAQKVKKLLPEYKQVRDKLKQFVPTAKKFEADAKAVADNTKHTGDADTSKLFGPIADIHIKLNKFEDEALATAYRIRDAKGDVQSQYAALAKEPGYSEKENKPFRALRAASFDIIMKITNPIGGAKHQIDRAVEVLLDAGGTTASLAKQLADRIKQDRATVAGKYGAATKA